MRASLGLRTGASLRSPQAICLALPRSKRYRPPIGTTAGLQRSRWVPRPPDRGAGRSPARYQDRTNQRPSNDTADGREHLLWPSTKPSLSHRSATGCRDANSYHIINDEKQPQRVGNSTHVQPTKTSLDRRAKISSVICAAGAFLPRNFISKPRDCSRTGTWSRCQVTMYW